MSKFFSYSKLKSDCPNHLWNLSVSLHLRKMLSMEDVMHCSSSQEELAQRAERLPTGGTNIASNKDSGDSSSTSSGLRCKMLRTLYSLLTRERSMLRMLSSTRYTKPTHIRTRKATLWGSSSWIFQVPSTPALYATGKTPNVGGPRTSSMDQQWPHQQTVVHLWCPSF